MRLSVCIPTFNRPEKLRRSLGSLVGQIPKQVEIVVHDNSDNSHSESVVQEFDFPSLRYLRHERNIGLVGNWNSLVHDARGTYIKFLNDDDWLCDNAIVTFLNDLDRHKAVLYQYPATHMTTAGKIQKVDLQPRGEFDGEVLASMLVKWGAKLGAPSQMMFDRAIAQEVGAFGDRMSYALDLELWVKLLDHGGACLSDKNVIRLEAHDGQVARTFDLHSRISDQQSIMRNIAKLSNSSLTTDLNLALSRVVWHEFALALRDRRFLDGIRALRRSRLNFFGLASYLKWALAR